MKHKIEGKILVKDERIALVVKEMIEGYASGRFQTKQEARFFLEASVDFPKGKSGRIGNSQVDKILTNPLYAGMIEYKPWDVSMRKGRHESLISYDTFCQIQDRLKGSAYAPTRKNISEDFPLRGSVECKCGRALTACWSKSRSGTLHPYYLCQNRKCELKGKSIRRDLLEGAFESMLRQLTPRHNLITLAEKMFSKLWEHRERSAQEHKSSLEKSMKKLDREIEQYLDRIIDTQSSTVIKALEKRIEQMEQRKLLLEEQFTNAGQPMKPVDEMYRTALEFLSSPYKIWENGGLAEKRAVLKLTLNQRLSWDEKGMYRTPNFSLPFKVLGDFFMYKREMVPRGGIEPPTRGFSTLNACASNILFLLHKPTKYFL
nr:MULTISPECIES: recombinase family protein [Pseudoalteromonas]